MSNGELVVFDCKETSCSDIRCHQLPQLLSATLANWTITHKTFDTFPKHSIQRDDAPMAICLQNFSTDRLARTIHRLRRIYGPTPLLGVCCEAVQSPMAFDYMKVSVLDDFVCCPFGVADLAVRIRRLGDIQIKQPENSSDPAEDLLFEIPGLVGKSPPFRKALGQIPLLSRSDAPVLILGETGTGKELFARAIHYEGPRLSKPFIPLNCGAIPDHLFESELFGHSKGAFTDAVATQPGLLREAEGGTLFLDELDTLSLSAQVKLLRFLQDGQYRSIGTTKFSRANVRILAATNQQLLERVYQGRFRQDLYYRLNYLNISIPPLRDRIEDIPRLAQYFLDHHAHKSKTPPKHLTPDGIQKLLMYEWPGNVRELEAVVCRSMTLHPEVLNLDAAMVEMPIANDRLHVSERNFQFAKARAVEEFERRYLLHILAQYRGNISHAAKAAGKERRTFKRLLDKYRIDRTICTNTPVRLNRK